MTGLAIRLGGVKKNSSFPASLSAHKVFNFLRLWRIIKRGTRNLKKIFSNRIILNISIMKDSWWSVMCSRP